MKVVEQLASNRKHRNRDIVKRMKAGDSLTSFDSWASWFPPRPIIKKNRKAQQVLYMTSRNREG